MLGTPLDIGDKAAQFEMKIDIIKNRQSIDIYMSDMLKQKRVEGINNSVLLRRIILAFLHDMPTVKQKTTNNSSLITSSEITEPKDPETVFPMSRGKCKIIIDTSGDDAAALIIAAKKQNAEVLGVAVQAGNIKLEQGSKKGLMTSEMTCRDEPVYDGASFA